MPDKVAAAVAVAAVAVAWGVPWPCVTWTDCGETWWTLEKKKVVRNLSAAQSFLKTNSMPKLTEICLKCIRVFM